MGRRAKPEKSFEVLLAEATVPDPDAEAHADAERRQRRRRGLSLSELFLGGLLLGEWLDDDG